MEYPMATKLAADGLWKKSDRLLQSSKIAVRQLVVYLFQPVPS
jgi:hypothetical protein